MVRREQESGEGPWLRSRWGTEKKIPEQEPMFGVLQPRGQRWPGLGCGSEVSKSD